MTVERSLKMGPKKLGKEGREGGGEGGYRIVSTRISKRECEVQTKKDTWQDVKKDK